jgi:predicted DNA-binding protein YlxM (UPF0122 family)
MGNPVLEKLRINELYDAYGDLLTAKQRQYVDYYYRDDYSLSEIAAIMGVSRNAVHNQLKIATEHMEKFEAKLGLVRIRRTAREIADRLGRLDFVDADVTRLLEELDKTE